MTAPPYARIAKSNRAPATHRDSSAPQSSKPHLAIEALQGLANVQDNGIIVKERSRAQSETRRQADRSLSSSAELQYAAEHHHASHPSTSSEAPAAHIAASIFLIACLIGPAALAATADDIGTAQSISVPRRKLPPATTRAAASDLPRSRVRAFPESGRLHGHSPQRLRTGISPSEIRVRRGENRRWRILQEVQIVDADGIAWDAL